MRHKYESSIKVIPIEKAIGKVLAHDVTEIRPGQFKGPAFKKGHILKEEDLEHLRRLGKEHLFVLQIGPGEVHEDEAAIRLAKALAGPGIVFDEKPSEGKISLKSAHRGLLKVNVKALTEFNLVSDVTCASRHTNVLVGAGEIVAATRAIPLVIHERSLNKAVRIAEDVQGIFSVKELTLADAGLVITGNEVYYGRIEDKFAPLIRKKLSSYGCTLEETIFAPDDKDVIVQGIKGFVEKGQFT